MKSYQTLEQVFKKLSDIERAQGVLSWDMAVTMPKGGAEARTEQLATLTSLSHAIIADDAIGELLDEAKGEKRLKPWQKSSLNVMRHRYKHQASVPQQLLTDLAKEGARCEFVWREARANNDFNTLKPHLKKVVDLVREVSKAKGEAFGCSPYEALLDQYDVGRTTAQLDEVFGKLENFLPEFIQKVVEKQKSQKPQNVTAVSIEKQRAAAHEVVKLIGLAEDHVRLDESHHPFCGGYLSDVRITTRYDEKNPLSSIMGVLHESGHALYECQLPSRWNRLPVGEAQGMSMHESQSLLLEMQIGRSEAFLNYLVPVLKKAYGTRSKAWDAKNIYQLCTQVEPSLIRVDADEVTYPAHIILRYHIEKYLLSGDMEVEDLPEAWAQGMQKFLGVKVPNDKDGCMQDIHWMDGTFGYFPTYTLGAIYAAQQFAAISKEQESLTSDLEAGKLDDVKEWLQKNIHAYGSSYVPDKLMKKVTGSALDVEAYIGHLNARYL